MRARQCRGGVSDLCDSTHCQRVIPSAVTPRLEAAAAATAGELLWYDGKPAFTPYTRDCGGRTEDAAAVWPDLAAPYLKSHADVWCVRGADSRCSTGPPTEASLLTFSKTLRYALLNIRIKSRFSIALRPAERRFCC